VNAVIPVGRSGMPREVAISKDFELRSFSFSGIFHNQCSLEIPGTHGTVDKLENV
jgi:hypothetical protein